MQRYDWPGNIRQLENMIRRAACKIQKWSATGVRVCNSHSCLHIVLPPRRTIILGSAFPNRPPSAAKALLTPYPGRFCRQLLCFDDFTAEHCLQAHENKYFTPKIRVGGVGRIGCRYALGASPGAEGAAEPVMPVPRYFCKRLLLTICI